MNGYPKITKWKRTSRESNNCLYPLRIFGFAKAEKLTFVEVNFETRKLLEKANN